MAGESTDTKPANSGREKQRKVIQACEKYWKLQEQGKKEKSMCNTFVLAVAHELKIPLDGPQANDIFDEVSRGGVWRLAGHGARAQKTVSLLARAGQFVIAVTKEDGGNGHVAVVVDWDEVGQRPRAYWGALHKGGKANSWLTGSWSATRLAPGYYEFTYDEFKNPDNRGIATDYDNISYFATDIPPDAPSASGGK